MKDYSITYHQTMEQCLFLWKGRHWTMRLYLTNEWNILPHLSFVKQSRFKWRAEFLCFGIANTKPYE